MSLMKDVIEILTVIASLSPFILVGFYFGKLDKRVSDNKKAISEIRQDVDQINMNLGVRNG